MSILDNQRHEIFAQRIAQGNSATQAYIKAGYTAKGNSAEAAASRLLSDVKVRDRVAELQSGSAQQAEITIASLTQMYLSDRELAYEVGQPAAARGAADSLAKLYGLFVDKKEIKRVDDFSSMSDDELDQFIAERTGGKPAAPVKQLTASSKVEGRS